MGVSMVLAVAACGGASSHSASTTKCPAGQVPVGVAGACAPPSTAPAQTQPAAPAAQPTTTSQASGSASPLALGQSADFAGNQIIGSGAGEGATVTVQRVIDPFPNPIVLGTPGSPPAGQRFVGVELTIQNTGTAPYSDSPGTEMSLISKSTNGPVGQAGPVTGAGQCATDLSASVNIPPGRPSEDASCFKCPPDSRSVRFSTRRRAAIILPRGPFPDPMALADELRK